jgi:hypothetical protein
VLLADRTAGAQPGVFQRGLAVTDLLAPSFAILVGDLVEGYLTDRPDHEGAIGTSSVFVRGMSETLFEH